MTNEPSPRPWRVEKAADEGRFWIVRNPDGVSIGMTWLEADAALIVSAVNERDRLRDIVRRLVNQFGNLTSYDDDAAILREARAAIGEGAR